MEETETKVCSKCGLEKSLSEYTVSKYLSTKRIYKTYCSKKCQECRKHYYEIYRITNSEKLKKYREDNRQKQKERNEKYRIENKEKIKEYIKNYRKTPEGLAATRNASKNSYYRNIEKVKEYRKSKEYREKQNNRNREKLKTPNGKIENSIRCRMREKIINGKCGNSMDILGCSIEECRKYLENKFMPGMTWDNHGQYGWHIDHIIPCASFDLTNPEEQIKCFHYTNLQPLWWEDNLSKQDKIEVFTTEGVFLI